MFKGYLSLGGTEIVNASRVEAYIRNNAPGIPLRNCYDCGSLAEALEDGVYDSPLVDSAPWIDPNNDSTSRFYGVYPLDIQGMEDSTRGATVTESIVDGGSVGSVRLGTRSIRVRALLLAADEDAMSAGMTWLRNALNPALCEAHGGSCGGAQLCYYSACPVIEPCYEDTYQAGFSVPIYGETPATSPVLFRETAIQNSLWRATLHPDDDIREGLILRWGAVSGDDTEVWLQKRGPIIMRRINYVPIPNMKGLTTPIFDFWDWDNTGSLVVVTMPDGVRALNYYGGMPGPDLSFNWVGAANNSHSEARLLSDSTLAYTNRFSNPNYMPAFAGPVTEIRRNHAQQAVPGFEWVRLGTDGVYDDEFTGGPVVDDFELDWAKITWAAPPTTTFSGFRTSSTGTSGDAVSANTQYTISMYGMASGPIAAEIRATWYNGATLLSTSVHPVTHSQAETWKRDNFTVTSPATATHVVVEYRFLNVDTAIPLGGWIGMTGLLIEQGTVLRKFFYAGMPDPSPFDDIIYTFSGPQTILTTRTIPHLPNTPVLGNAVGAYSIDLQGAVVLPLGTGSNDTYITYGAETGMQLGMVAGGTYAAKASFSQYDAPMAEPIHQYARSIVVMVDGQVFAQSQQAPNVINDSFDLQVDFTVPLDATDVSVRFYHGSETGVVYWHYTSLIEIGPSGSAPYRGFVFDGDSSDSPRVNRSGDMAMTNTEVTVSFDAVADSTAGSDLTVRLRSSADDTILASALFSIPPAPIYDPENPNPTWTRYSFTSLGTTGTAYLEFVRGGGSLVTNILIERGSFPLPYFDGSSSLEASLAGYYDTDFAVEEQYENYWHGDVDRSASQIDYLLLPTFGGSPIPDIWNSTTDGICGGIPRVDIAQGTLRGTLGVGLRLPIPWYQQVEHLERTLHEVTAVEGPLVIEERALGTGVMREVDFLLVAGRPSPYGPTRQIMDQKMSELNTTPWVDSPCVDDEPVLIVDPDCPPVPAPPRPPSIPNACVTEESIWQRYWLPIEKEWVSSWSTTAPQVTITSGAQDIRQIRVRVFPNPFDRDFVTSAPSYRNGARNPKLHTDTAGWYSGGGTSTTRVSNTVTPTGEVWSYRVAMAAGVAPASVYIRYGASAADAVAVVAGETFDPGALIRTTSSRQLVMAVKYYTAGWVQVGAEVVGTAFNHVAGPTWTYGTLGATPSTVPATAVWATVEVRGFGTNWTLGNMEIAGWNMQIAPAGVERGQQEYWDGDTANSDGFYRGWSGTPDLSTSYAIKSPVDPCSFCSEFVVSYLPAQTVLTVDSILERAFASVAGGASASANHLLYSGDGSPMTWPELGCGNPYYMAIDVPEPLLDDVRVRVTLTNKE